MDMNGKTCREIISAEQIAAKVATLGEAITRDYERVGQDLVLVGVMKGSVMFLADLCRRVVLPCTIDLIGIASYGNETTSSGVVQITSDLTRPIEGKHVLLIEDIVDTGLTMEYLLDNFETRKPKSVKICALLHKPSRARVPVDIDYVGFTIEDRFVVGYGLDYAQRYRNLPYIAEIDGANE